MLKMILIILRINSQIDKFLLVLILNLMQDYFNQIIESYLKRNFILLCHFKFHQIH